MDTSNKETQGRPTPVFCQLVLGPLFPLRCCCCCWTFLSRSIML